MATKSLIKPNEVPGAIPTEPMNTPISAQQLSSATTATLTPPKPGTQVAGMLGEIQSGTDAFTQNLKTQTEQAKKGFESARSPYQEFLGSLRGEASLTSEAYDTGGVNTVEKELNDINQQIRNEQRSLENTIRNLEERGGGLQGGVQAEVNNARRESLRTQADLYVIQQGVQGRYDSAKAIADRAVTAYMEEQKLELEALQFNYLENKDLFTKAEQREFDVTYDARKRALDREEVDLKTISDLSLDALQNGAPKEVASRMRQAKTPQEAMEIGGQYIGRLQRLQVESTLESARINRLVDLANLGQPAALKALGIPTSDGTEPSDDLIAFAELYASTGKKPTGIPKDLTFGEIADYAKSIPKKEGTLVNTNTGVTDTSLGTAEQGDISRLYNIVKLTEKLEDLDKQRFSGIVAGSLGKVFGSETQGSYLTTRKAIVDEIARMQTGAALTVDEQAFYNEYLPGRFAEPFGIGQDPEDRIANFKEVMVTKLDNALANNQLGIYGYSKVGDYKLGEVITNEQGQRGIVGADGSVTLLK